MFHAFFFFNIKITSINIICGIHIFKGLRMVFFPYVMLIQSKFLIKLARRFNRATVIYTYFMAEAI